jgi:hypothetical protein
MQLSVNIYFDSLVLCIIVLPFLLFFLTVFSKHEVLCKDYGNNVVVDKTNGKFLWVSYKKTVCETRIVRIVVEYKVLWFTYNRVYFKYL